jgi:hypothetical protein
MLHDVVATWNGPTPDPIRYMPEPRTITSRSSVEIVCVRREIGCNRIGLLGEEEEDKRVSTKTHGQLAVGEAKLL